MLLIPNIIFYSNYVGGLSTKYRNQMRVLEAWIGPQEAQMGPQRVWLGPREVHLGPLEAPMGPTEAFIGSREACKSCMGALEAGIGLRNLDWTLGCLDGASGGMDRT